MSILIADIETNDLDPNIIWMVGVLDYKTDVFTSYHGDDVAVGILRLLEADRVIFYNGLGFDVPVMERLTEGLAKFDRQKIIECLNLSRSYVSMANHKLATWGEIFGFPKGDHSDFSRYSEEMRAYCERDCRLTKMIFEFLHEQHIKRGKKTLLVG